ncbi:alpha/beta hydrolase family protein [Roseateles paludis]|uniref:CocE/NonD family hydrolase n=1 Tax=Roseateles paludis TaxID=3145238 RepID=A0ABV0FXB3_9BURK
MKAHPIPNAAGSSADPLAQALGLAPASMGTAMKRGAWRLLAVVLLACMQPATAMVTEPFSFQSGGHRLSGFLDRPDEGVAQGVVIIIHGYGRTDVKSQTSWADLRQLFTSMGLATVVWDKPGCGHSEGEFDANQPVADSAREVVDAAQALRARGVAGAAHIGLWGISRAGWIAPLAIQQDRAIAFWISVSGVDDQESFGYLLHTNLLIEGRTPNQAQELTEQWKQGGATLRAGGSYQDYLAATQDLRKDPFLMWLGFKADEPGFRQEQAQWLAKPGQVHPETGLVIYVPGFADILAHIDIPVLAVFGEKDSSVDWRRTQALYERTLGRNLTVLSFANANHNLHQAKTGGLREMMEMQRREPVPGYREAMAAWLRQRLPLQAASGGEPGLRPQPQRKTPAVVSRWQ